MLFYYKIEINGVCSCMLLPNSLVFALIPIALVTLAVATVAFSLSTFVLSPSANHPIGAL